MENTEATIFKIPNEFSQDNRSKSLYLSEFRMSCFGPKGMQ